MQNGASAVTETEILSHVIEIIDRDRWRELADTFSKLRLPEQDLERVDRLLEKNRSGKITMAERAELEKYLRVGNFVALMRARALRELGRASKT